MEAVKSEKIDLSCLSSLGLLCTIKSPLQGFSFTNSCVVLGESRAADIREAHKRHKKPFGTDEMIRSDSMTILLIITAICGLLLPKNLLVTS